jgi:non-haem Fe2+, alpha-ketoglutarate-dependent halogenase
VRLQWREYSISGHGLEKPSAEPAAAQLVIDTDADPRELSFRAVDTSDSKVLTDEQIKFFNENGFLSSLPAFGAAEISEIRQYIDDLVRKVVEAPDRRNAYSVFNYQLVCRGMYEIIQTPAILDYAEDLVGKNFVCWNTHLFFKAPHDPLRVPFHQDAVYWPLTPSRTITVWLALDDVDEENAAMQFLPGSHLQGPLVHEQKSLDGTRALKREAVAPGSRDAYFTNALRAGEISVHSDLLLHGSAANMSGRRRAGLTIRYAPADVRPLPGAEWYANSSVHCRGTIPGHWPNRRKPSSEHPELLSHLWGDFDGTPYSHD